MDRAPRYGGNTSRTAFDRAGGASSVDLVLDTEPSAADETAAAAAPTDADAAARTRRGRVRKFDRPPPPKDWRWWVSGLGKVLIAAGLLMFGFVAYQLWGTGIENARAQASLESEFEELLAEAPPVTVPATSDAGDTGDDAETDTDPPPDDGSGTDPDDGSDTDPVDSDPSGGAGEGDAETVPIEQQNLPEVQEGDPIARLEIPRIGADDIVVAGVSKGDLKKGPGHFPETPLPGQLGNAAIAGHRTTYGQPFFDVDDLEPGDEIIATTLNGRFVYRVTGTQIVSPDDYWVVSTTDPTTATLTLTSCHPKWTARERIIVFAELDPRASTAVGAPVLNYGRAADTDTDTRSDADASSGQSASDPDVSDGSASSDSVPADSVPADPVPADSGDVDDAASPATPAPDASGLGSEEINAGIADAFSDGWFSDPDANGQVLLWGLLLAAVGIVSYLISRTFKRDWVGALVGIVPFLVTLYFFFQNVNRLLPPNL